MDLNRLVADAILAAAADVVVATDRDGIIQVWNPGAERIFGHRADEALGQSLDLIIPSACVPATGKDSVMSWRRARAITARATSCQYQACARMGAAQEEFPMIRQRST
jgi:PAS domain-containing protein